MFLSLSFSLESFASECWKFDVTAYADKIGEWMLPVTRELTEDKAQEKRLNLVARTKDLRWILTEFKCEKTGGWKYYCSNEGFAGDFEITFRPNKPIEITSDYINLSLGAKKGLPSRQDTDEITEELALVNEGEHDHPEPMDFTGTLVKDCKIPADYLGN